jgi:hypothetical protein
VKRSGRRDTAEATEMGTAGQLVDYTRRLTGHGTPGFPAWNAAASAGTRAMRLAWQQHQKYAALEYRAPWSLVTLTRKAVDWTDEIGY